jgi:methionyl-tRNA synthetase
MTSKKILITAALPYANGVLHFGHLAGAYLPADCYARFQRRMGNDVCFMCGSDEYGVAISLSAELAKRTPKEHVDIFHEKNKNIFHRVGMSFDHYSRTTNPIHAETTREFFLVLKENGLVEKNDADQLFCEEDGKFYADRYVVGTCPQCGYDAARGDECTKCGASYEATDLKNPKTKIGGKALIRRVTTHWYIKLDAQKEKLLQWIQERQWKPNVINFVKQYISELRPRAITRDMDWGISVPDDSMKGKVFYVWFDAPIGYISATKEWALLQGDETLWKQYWFDPSTKFVQFIGKDNIPFHAAFFPAVLMGQNEPYKLVDDLPANEFYTLAGKQFSKSDGWYIDVEEFLDTYSTDQLRYAILSNAPETQDSEFTWKDFQSRSNSDLLGKMGNFVHRTLVFLQLNCSGRIPVQDVLLEQDNKFLQQIQSLEQEISSCFESYRLRRACQCIMEVCQASNVYFDQNKPWILAKEETQRKRMETVLSLCLRAVVKISTLIEPILPNTSEAMMKFLGIQEILKTASWSERLSYSLEPGTSLLMPTPLFKKVEDTMISQEEEKLQKLLSPQIPEQSPVTTVPYSDFVKLKFEVIQIIQAERVPKSQKLLKLQVQSSKGMVQVISGIGLQYAPESLIGKKAVALMNLHPTKIMGQESQAMLLAAGNPPELSLLFVDGVSVGTAVT